MSRTTPDSPSPHRAQSLLREEDLRFFWTEKGSPYERRNYHYVIDCAFLMVDIWHGATLVTASAPPNGADVTWAGRVDWIRQFPSLVQSAKDWPSVAPSLGEAAAPGGRSLCAVCEQYVPAPVRIEPDPVEPRCAACHCRESMHSHCRSAFDHGCGMAWALEYGYGSVGLRHCPCDGYQIPGSRPLAAADELRTPTHLLCLYLRRDLRPDPTPTALQMPVSSSPAAAARRPRPSGCVSDGHRSFWLAMPNGTQGCLACHPWRH